MFQTIGYKGHYIQISYNPCEVIRVQIVYKDGNFDLISVRTLIGAKRLITKHVKSMEKNK